MSFQVAQDFPFNQKQGQIQDYELEETYKDLYIILKKHIPPLTPRIINSKQLLSEYKEYRSYVCSVEELFKTPIQAYRTTQLKTYKQVPEIRFELETDELLFAQKFVDYYNSLFPRLEKKDKQDGIDNFRYYYIDERINRLETYFKYWLEQLRENLHKQAAEYEKNFQDRAFSDLKEKIQEKINPADLKLRFDEFYRRQGEFADPKLGESYTYRKNQENFFTYQWDSLNDEVTNYVQERIYGAIDKNEEALTDKLNNAIIQKQNFFFNVEQIDNGISAIKLNMKEMEKCFGKREFNASGICNNFALQHLEVTLKDRNLKDPLVIYDSKKEGLNYSIIVSKADKMDKKHLLFTFKTDSNQFIAIYVDAKSPTQKSFMIQMSKGEVYKVIDQSKPFEINTRADSSSWLFNFGPRDLIVKSSFDGCTSELNSGFATGAAKVGDFKEHLANLPAFKIMRMEIIELPELRAQN